MTFGLSNWCFLFIFLILFILDIGLFKGSLRKDHY